MTMKVLEEGRGKTDCCIIFFFINKIGNVQREEMSRTKREKGEYKKLFISQSRFKDQKNDQKPGLFDQFSSILAILLLQRIRQSMPYATKSNLI